jgi:hypothetical protein
MTEARQHHIVPQCYLKGFTHDRRTKSLLFAIEVKTGRSFTTPPQKVAKQRDFNRIEGLPAGELDNRLSRFETKLADALDRIAAARSLQVEDDWLHVLNLIGLLAVRNPRLRENMRRFQEDISRKIMSVALSTKEMWESQIRKAKKAGDIEESANVTYEQVKEFHKNGKYTIEVPTTRHIQTEFKIFNTVLDLLYRRKWMLCIAQPSSGGFITSDHPVCLIHSDGAPSTLHRPVGYGVAETTVIFPISSELLVVGTFEGTAGTREVTQTQAAYLNAVLCGHSGRHIFAPNDEFSVMFGPGTNLVRGCDLPAFLRARSSSA